MPAAALPWLPCLTVLISCTLLSHVSAFPRLGASNCTEKWFTQDIDHFAFGKVGTPGPTTFSQRYLVYWKYWKGNGSPWFFYAGNEGNVEGYANATGLMWENAKQFNALIVFAEHRYYGKSQPFGADSWKVNPAYLTTEQALADYAVLLWRLTGELNARGAPIIAFGGSYGGMLAAWMRVKYPHIIAGAIAASAPVAAFSGTTPEFKPSAFWEVVTRDASEAAGAAPGCADNVRAAFKQLFILGGSAGGRQQLQSSFRLCDPLKDAGDVEDLAYWVQGAFDSFAMGNYPYPSDYMAGTWDHPLPAWPMREACKFMGGSMGGAVQLMEGLSAAAAVMYNVTEDVTCFKMDLGGPAAGCTGAWDWQFCTEMMAQELPYFPATGVTDMFWDQGPFNLTAIGQHCQEAWGVEPRPHWSVIQYGGYDYSSASNIVFSNGLYDPWSAFGIMQNVSESVVSVLIPEGAHHLDLMFTHPDDPPSVMAARGVELQHISKWIVQHVEQRRAAAAATTVVAGVLAS